MATKQYDAYADLITFTRASSGTYLDSDGVLKTATTNTPRIEYDADGNRLGLLIEEARTNLEVYSNDFTQWVNAESTDSLVSGVTNPFGSASIAKLVASGNAIPHSLTNIAVNTTSGTVYTHSVYAKAGEYDYIGVALAGTSFAGEVVALFNLANGTLVAVDNGSTSVVKATSINPVGNGWYRCSVSADASATSTGGPRIIVQPNDTINSTAAGDGASGIYIYGAQLEAGSFATSYIGTSGATATRSADVASIPTSAFGYNQKAGTVVVTGCKIDRVSTIAGTDITTLSKVAFNTNDATRVFYRASGATGFFNTVSASQNVDLSPTGVLAAGQNLNIAFTYSEDDFATVANGGTVLTDTSGVVAEHTVLQIGAGQQYLNGHIKSVQYYPRRLTNAQIQRLTA